MKSRVPFSRRGHRIFCALCKLSRSPPESPKSWHLWIQRAAHTSPPDILCTIDGTLQNQWDQTSIVGGRAYYSRVRWPRPLYARACSHAHNSTVLSRASSLVKQRHYRWGWDHRCQPSRYGRRDSTDIKALTRRPARRPRNPRIVPLLLARAETRPHFGQSRYFLRVQWRSKA